MILARSAVAGAILCTLWFNASYAWSKGGALPHQLSMVALAITVDLCKSGFPVAASLCWQRGLTLPAVVLAALWLPAITFSTFAGYAAITTQRTASSATQQHEADAQRRRQSAYDELQDGLALATASALWRATAGCSTTRTRAERAFCDARAAQRQRREQLADELGHKAAPVVDAELSLLAATTGWPTPLLALLVALWPALLIELVASLGLYAVTPRLTRGPAAAASEAVVAPAPAPSEPDAISWVLKPANSDRRGAFP